jgi:PAS domain S-box-containing protein
MSLKKKTGLLRSQLVEVGGNNKQSNPSIDSYQNTIRLVQALNAAAASIQKSVYSEEKIYHAFSEQVRALGLRGGLILLDETGTKVIIRAVAYSAVTMQVLSQLEKILNLKVIGHSIPLDHAEIYNNIIKSRQCVFRSDNTETIKQLIPPFAKKLTERIIAAFGKVAVVYAPLIIDERVIGILNIAGKEITEDDVPAIQAFANHIAIAVTNHRLYLETQKEIAERKSAELKLEKQYSELQTIYKISQELQQLETPQELAERIIATLEKNLGYEYGAILLIDESTQSLIPFAVSDGGQGRTVAEIEKAHISSHYPRLGQGIVGWVAQHGKSVCVGNVNNDPRYYAIRTGMQSELCVPLSVSNKIIGVINIETTRPNAYDESDQRILETVASQIAITIYNSHLYEQVKIELAERKRIEEKLLQSEEHFRSLIENASDIITILEANGVVRYESPAIERVLGYSPEELVGQNIFEFVHPDDLPIVLEAFSRTFPTPGVSASAEFRIKHKDGSWRALEAIGKSTFDETGELIAIVNSRDITDRKKTEEALAESEAHLRTIIESEPECVKVVSTQGVLLNMNPAGLRMVEADTLSAIVNKPVSHLIHPDDRKAFNKLHRRVCDGENGELEFRIIGLNGTIRWMETHSTPLRDPSGKITSVLSVTRDITERKRAEETIQRHAAELEQRVEERTIELTHANRAKDEFLANMSHELRTPLNSILGFSESLLEQQRGLLNDKQEQYVNLIHSSGKHLLSLINDILEFSKIEAGKIELRTDLISVKEICESSLNFITEMAAKKSIAVEFNNKDAVSTLIADPQRLKQILVNLLNNAVKFTPQKGMVSLDVQLNKHRNQICFAVTDNGIGIASEDLPKLFNPFTQLDSSLSRQYEGTGLGLVLIMKLTELHGGSVKVESELGKGSCFTVILPWNEEESNSQKQVLRKSEAVKNLNQPMLNSSPRGNILLAEDNESNILAIQDTLADHGYMVTVARNGREAIAIAEESPPDLILMDIQMPQMDGIEATRRLRTKPEFVSVPIIALTALAMPGDRERCLESGANEYISKPVSPKELRKIIETFLNK